MARVVDGDLIDSILLLGHQNIYLIDEFSVDEAGFPVDLTEYAGYEDKTRWIIKQKPKLKKIAPENMGKRPATRSKKMITILLRNLAEVHTKRYWLTDIGIELLSSTGKSYFIVTNLFERADIVNEIVAARLQKPKKSLPNLNVGSFISFANFLKTSDELFMGSSSLQNANNIIKTTHSVSSFNTSPNILKKVVPLWENGRISNFDYIMVLNLLSGRSLLDNSQYPIFPWVLQNYLCSNKELDLSNSSNYRDLSKPVGALKEERATEAAAKYEYCSAEEQGFPPFHYGSHYSNPMTVLYYQVRMMPFTHSAIKVAK